MRLQSWDIASHLLLREEQEAPRVEQRCDACAAFSSTKQHGESGTERWGKAPGALTRIAQRQQGVLGVGGGTE